MNMAETNYDGPRSMFPEEYDELMDLKEIAYGETRRHFLDYFPHTAKRENFIFDNRFIIKQNGKMLSHVGLIPMDVYAAGSKVKVGGIGGVATHPDARCKGFMGKSLNYSTERMREKGIPLSILWGDTQRYRYFGWETAGRQMVFQLSKRSVRGINVGKGFTFRGYRGGEYLDLIAGIHEKEPLRCVRSLRDYEQLLQRTQTEVWLGDEGNSWTYAVFSGNEVIEFGGEPSTVAKLFTFMLHHYPMQTIKVYTPYRESLMLHTLYGISFCWEVVPLGMIKVVNLERVLRCFRGQLQKKAELFKIERGMGITLRMDQSEQQATIIVREELGITTETSQEVILLSDIELVRLLFGPSAEDFGENVIQKRLLNCLFPLDFYVWGIDAV
jgi:predicted N-acetyltransferase YhbS